MGFRFRKSKSIGKHTRINVSKSGVGFSFGGKGARITKKAGGGIRTTLGIPGTGISYQLDSKKSSGCIYWVTIGWIIFLFVWMFKIIILIYVWLFKAIVWFFKAIVKGICFLINKIKEAKQNKAD